ncbi:MAG: helix-turn-helix domain-containing protein [Egibacteraceae bacterium]
MSSRGSRRLQRLCRPGRRQTPTFAYISKSAVSRQTTQGWENDQPTGVEGSIQLLKEEFGRELRRLRRAVNLTQDALARQAGYHRVSITQLEKGRQESGLKPLTTLPAAEFVRLRIRLIRLGAPPVIVDTLDEALSADMIISEAVEVGSDLAGQDNHLLASFVHKRDLTNMITWPFTGVVPDRIRFLESLRSNHCRHRVDAFGLDETERARFFDYLLVTAEASTYSDTILPRRQAIYLLGFDARSESAEWLRSEQRRAWHCAHPGTDVPTWAAVRSSALTLARFGDRDPVQAFVQHGLANEQQEVANLNYWAYWVGEIPHIEPDDVFMVVTDVSSWDGSTLLRHLLNRLEVGSEHADLNIHTLWTLLQARPSLLQIHTTLRSLARERIEQLMDDRELSAQTRQKLPALAYAIRLAER